MHVGAFFWACIFICVCAYTQQCMCTLEQDQWTKSTLERVAQSSSPTQLSPFFPPPLSSYQCCSAPSSHGVEQFTGLGWKGATSGAKKQACMNLQSFMSALLSSFTSVVIMSRIAWSDTFGHDLLEVFQSHCQWKILQLEMEEYDRLFQNATVRIDETI